MADLGRAALVTAFLLLAYATLAGTVAARRRRRRLALSAQNALVAALGGSLVAATVLLAALARHDFSFRYVAEHTSKELPLGYTLTAFWGGQEGSLLLWLLVLTGYSVAAVLTARRAGREVLAWVVPTLGLVGTFFALLLVFVASPFATQVAPADGAGLNPSLQNPYMAVHPLMLYLGYVGLTVPFAFAMGALLARRTDERWIVATRRWTLAAWTFLGVGQLLGAHWAYVEIGWGGYYAWDPVDPLVHAELDRRVVPRLHLPGDSGHGGADPVAAAAASRAHTARIARLAGGDLPLQQPAARRPDADDPLGRRLSAALRGR